MKGRRTLLTAAHVVAIVIAVSVAGCSGRAPAAVGAMVDLTKPGVAVVQAPDVVDQPAADQVAGILADITDFWQGTLGSRFTPLRSGFALIDTAGEKPSPDAMCVSGMAALRGNAFYCPGNDGIVVDAAALIPVIGQQYGIGGLAVSLAHEFGHAVQARIGPTQADREKSPTRFPQVLIEAQADCMAGAFLRWASDGNATRLKLPAVPDLATVGPLLDFRDTSSGHPADSLAHGLGLDRWRFLLLGYRSGVAECSSMTVASLHLTLGREGTAPHALPRFTDDAGIEAAAKTSIATVVGIDLPPGTPKASAEDLAAAAPYGQFATAAATAFAVGRSMHPTGSGASCVVGAWVAAVFGIAPAGALGAWPGDADEAMDFLRARPGSTFADLVSYADGFDKGLSNCSSAQ